MCASRTSLALAAVALCAIAAAAHAQPAAGGDAIHERLEVTIREDGSAHVLHEVKPSDSPVTLLSVDGDHSNVRVRGEGGVEVGHAVTEREGGFGVEIPASEAATTVEYDLAGAVSEAGAYLAWEYSYPSETLFAMPPGIGRAYVNGAAVDITGGRFLCHGCYAMLEWSPDERIYSYPLGGEAPELRMEIRTAAAVDGAGIDTGVGVISAEIVAEGRAFVDVAVPKALLAGPYEAYLDGSRVMASVSSENATHAWLQAQASGGTLNVFGEGSVPDAGGMAQVGLAVIAAGGAGIAVTLAVWARRRGGAR